MNANKNIKQENIGFKDETGELNKLLGESKKEVLDVVSKNSTLQLENYELKKIQLSDSRDIQNLQGDVNKLEYLNKTLSEKYELNELKMKKLEDENDPNRSGYM